MLSAFELDIPQSLALNSMESVFAFDPVLVFVESMLQIATYCLCLCLVLNL